MRTKIHTYKLYLIALLLVIALSPSAVFALTPIARYDVVPNQRVEYGSTFKFGVVAFSKAQIASVKFTISGRGYSGGVKSATTMTYNDRTETFEYWVPISSSEFTSNGTFTVTAVATGKDGGSRNLGALTMNVDATGSLAQPSAWVSPNGSDSTGKVNVSSQPSSSLAGAIAAIQAANSGSADGGMVYLNNGTYDGTYDVGSSTKTSNEWLTITKASSASKTSVILRNARAEMDTHLLRLKDITIQNSSGYAVPNGVADYVWFDNARIIGSGRDKRASNPIQNRKWATYWTGNYMYNMDFAIAGGILSRGNNISTLSDDAHQNTWCVINDRVDDVDPEPQYPANSPHADAYQMHVTNLPSPDNIIVYGLYATNLHYQGIFARPSSEGSPVKSATNVALVNNFFESRSPLRSPGGGVSSLQGIWDHLVLWNNTFATKEFVIYKDTSTDAFSFKNVSMIGNYFYGFRDASSNGKAFDKGNNYNNVSISNHYYLSYDDGSTSDNRLHSPDTQTPASDTSGTVELDLSDKTNYVHFGYPLSTSVLLNRIDDVVMPADTVNAERGSVSDIGAFESGVSANKSPPSPPQLY
jgi:hypothetical protein